MSSEDKRIVILEFDNSKFDKNVEKSNETLQKLKENLKLDGASRGLDAISSTAKRFDISNIGQSIGTVTTKFSALEVIGKRVLENLTDSAMRFGSNLVNSIVEPIKSGGWRRAMNLEQANFQLEGLLGGSADGAEKIAAIMESVNQSVKGTAYGLDQAAKVASQFVATGIEDADQMLSYLKGVAGAAAMTGRNYDDIGRIFTTVAGQGRLMGDQLLQFASSGLNVAATLSKQMNITEAEFRDMVSKGEISFDQFASGMAEAFGEHATKANETFTGSLSNMRAALARIGADVATPALKNFRDIFNSLRPLIDNVHEALKPFINTLNFDFSTATKNSVKTLGWLNDKLKAFLGDTKKTAEDTEDVAATAAKAAEEIEKVAREVLSGKYGNGEERRAALEALGYSYEEVQNKVNELVGCDFRYEVQAKETTKTVEKQTSAFKDLQNKIDSVKEAQEKADQSFRERASNNFFAGIRKMIVVVSQYGKAANSAFREVFSGSFSKHIYNLAYNFRKFTDTLKLNETQADGVKRIFTGLFSVIKFGLGVVGNIAREFGKFLGFFVELGKRALEFIGSVTDIDDAIDRLSKHFNGFETLRDVFSKLSTQVESFRQKFKETASAVKDSSGFKHLQETAENLWTAIKGIAKSFGESLLNKFQKFSETKLDFSWLDRITELVSSASDRVATFIDNLLAGESPINAFFNSFSGKATTWFREFLELARIAKNNIAEFFKNFKFSENFNNFVENLQNMSLTDIGQSILDFINSLLESLSNIQEGDGNGLITKIENFFANVKEKFNKIQEDLADVDWEHIKQEAQKVIQTILALGAIFLMASVLMSGVKFFNSLANLANSASGALDVISGRKTAMDKIPGIIDSVTKMLAVIAGSIAVLSLIDDSKRTAAIEDLLVLLGGIAGALAIIGGIKIIDGKKIEQIGKAFQGIGIGVAALMVSVLVLGNMNWEKALKGIGFIGLIMLELSAAARIVGSSELKTSAAFMALAVAVDLLVPAVWLLGTMKTVKAYQGALTIGFIVLELAAAARIAGSVKAAAAFLGLAIAVDLLIPALLIFGITPWETILKGVITLSAVLLSIGASARLAKSVNPMTIVALALTLGVAIAGLYVLSDIPEKNLLVGALALGAVILAVGAAAKSVDSGGVKGVGLMVAMCIPLGVVALSLYELAKCEWTAILSAAFSISRVFGAISKAIKVLGEMKLGAGIQGIVLVDAFIASLALTFSAIGWFFKDVIKTTEYLDTAIEVMKKIGTAIGEFVWGILNPGGGVPDLGQALEDFGSSLGIFGENIKPFIDAVAGISAETGDKLKILASSLLEITAAELLDQLSQLIGGEGVLVTFGHQLVVFGQNLDSFTSAATKDGKIDSAVAAVEKAAGIFPMLKENGIHGGALGFIMGSPLKNLATQLNEFSFIAQGIFKVDSANIESVRDAMGPAVEAYQKMQESGIKGGILGLLTGNPMGHLGNELKKFTVAVQGMQTVPEVSVFENIRDAIVPATEAFKTVNASGIKGGILGSVLMQGNPMKHLGEEMANFSQSVKDVIKVPDVGVFESIRDAVGPATEAFKAVHGSGILGGLLGSVLGQGNPMKHLGEELKNFADNVKDIADVDATAVTNVAKAVTNAAPSFSDVIDAGIKGGLEGWWEGNPMKNLGEQLSAFATAVSGMPTDIDTATVTKINELVPGAVQVVKDASAAGEEANGYYIEDFFAALEIVTDRLSVFGVRAALILTDKIESMADTTIPKVISITDQLGSASTAGVESYGNTLAAVGEKIKEFSESISSANVADMETVSNSISQIISSVQTQVESGVKSIGGFFASSLTTTSRSAVSAMANTINTASGMVTIAVNRLGSSATKALESVVPDFAKISKNATNQFVHGLTNAQNAVSSASTALDNKAIEGISNTARTMGEHGDRAGSMFATSIGSNASKVLSAAQSLYNQAISGIQETARTMGEYGRDAGIAFANGISSSEYDAYNSGYGLSVSAANGASSSASYETFYSIGVNSAQGMINGLSSGYDDLYWTAYNMAASAASAASAALDIHSPSRVMYSIGDYAIQGFVDAFNDGSKIIFTAGDEMAETALRAVTKPVEMIQRILNTDLDLTPTITPVIDLSNLENGTLAANGMLSGLNGQLYANTLSVGSIGAGQTDTGALQYERILDILSRLAEDDGIRPINNNTFNITGDNPREIAEEVSKIIQSQVERRGATWA